MATLKDVARLAGVSESTASRSLRNLSIISEETRRRVKAAAESLDFEFNAVARGLSTRRRNVVGVAYPDFTDESRHSYYLDLLIHDIRHDLEKAGYDCLIFKAEDPRGDSNIRRLARQGKVDGFVFVLSNVSADDWALIRERGIPAVQLHSRPGHWNDADAPPDCDFFFTDNFRGGELAAEHLAERGVRRFVCLADDSGEVEMAQRLEGFLAALAARGVAGERIEIRRCAGSYSEVRRYVSANIGGFLPGDGIFAHTDIMALTAMQVLISAGVSIPGDIRIIGFDDIPFCRLSVPTLTSIHQPREEEARRGTERLVELIEGGAEGRINELIEPYLVERGSSA
jgi:LacI family transcriptional regulator